MKLDYLQALKRVDEARGVWILHGQEPLLEQNLLDALRKSWTKHEIERQRHDLNSVSDWKNVFNALNSLSLFSQHLALEVHGNIKPDANGLKQLKQYIQHNEHNLLLIVLPKQDSSSLKSAFFQVVEANGVVVIAKRTYRAASTAAQVASGLSSGTMMVTWSPSLIRKYVTLASNMRYSRPFAST